MTMTILRQSLTFGEVGAFCPSRGFGLRKTKRILNHQIDVARPCGPLIDFQREVELGAFLSASWPIKIKLLRKPRKWKPK